MKTSLRNIATAAALLIAAGSSSFVSADIASANLRPLQAHTVNLKDHTAVVYYVKLSNGNFQVITTTGPNEGIEGQISRHQAVVRPGQNYIFSLDTGVAGSPANAINFSAENDKLVVASR